ncbi:MAG: ATP-binding protein [Nitrososphaera sp.]
MGHRFHLLTHKIIFRLAILIAIEVLLVVGSFGISTYIQSQSTGIGSTINIAGKNRYLTSNLLLELEKLNEGTAQIEDLTNATDALNTNIMFLRAGGELTFAGGTIFLKPLEAKYLDKWYEISEKGSTLNRYVSLVHKNDFLSAETNGNSPPEEPQLSSLANPREALAIKASIETTASQLIKASDDFTRQLSEDDRLYSQNLVAMQTAFIIGSVLVGCLILYIMKRLLRPISLIIKATEEVKKGDLAISPIPHCDGRDEVGVLAASFNSMIKQLAEYEGMRKDFINIAAHELRTPIQPILGLAQVALSKSRDESQRESLEVVVRNARRLKTLTENVLDIARIENEPLKLNKEKFNLNDLLLNVLSEYQSPKDDGKRSQNLKILFTPKDELYVEADKERLTQVISNVMNNAVKFTLKGTITVTTEKREGNNEIIVNIEDTGSGIDSEIMPKLFTKFATKSETGTGLGLFVSRNIVEAHGGKMWGENNKDGKGATFTFTLPIIN